MRPRQRGRDQGGPFLGLGEDVGRHRREQLASVTVQLLGERNQIVKIRRPIPRFPTLNGCVIYLQGIAQLLLR